MPKPTPPTVPLLRTGRSWTIASVVAVGGLVVLGFVALRSPSEPTPEGPRARVYRDVDVCLLTDSKGLGAEPARRTWQGLQSLSRNGSARLSYVAATAPDTPASAAPFVAGLIQRKCDVIVATGAAGAAAVDSAATRAPGIRFVSLSPNGATHGNVTALDPAAPGLDASVADVVRRAVGG